VATGTDRRVRCGYRNGEKEKEEEEGEEKEKRKEKK